MSGTSPAQPAVHLQVLKEISAMLKNLIGAFIIFRLEMRQLPIDPGLVVALWRHRTAIAVVIDHGAECRQQLRLIKQLDEVYPF